MASIDGQPVADSHDAAAAFAGAMTESRPLSLGTAAGKQIELPATPLPERSRPVHPTQIYAAINAGLLGWFLWAYCPARRRDGEVVGLLLTLYPLGRFLLEAIRTDEGSFLGTGLSISQNISIGSFLIGVGLFVVAGFIFTFFARPDSGIEGYVDALYYTVTTVTTTGFGDVVLPGAWGRLTAIIVMIFGLGLFVRLAQAVFRPNKVHFPCPNCGLNRHDPDAVHCKACGETLAIPDEGRS